MRKLVLGIIAVVCVQFAFVNYMELQSPLELAIAPVFTAPTAVNTDLSWIEELDRSPLTSPEPESVAAAPVETRRRDEGSPRNRSTQPVVNTDRPEPFRTAQPSTDLSVRRNPAYLPARYESPAPGEFETVVISYNRSPEMSACDRFDTPKTKKRSYIAKAAPAVKKPWEWMKSVASKLY